MRGRQRGGNQRRTWALVMPQEEELIRSLRSRISDGGGSWPLEFLGWNNIFDGGRNGPPEFSLNERKATTEVATSRTDVNTYSQNTDSLRVCYLAGFS
ncbi:hypothetical protein EVAR_51367_1 [Eumeta japonica]|uniref:Uncharacterized protein n=1 Tax=Eumeta variegata TaxID=151549 RepID=A0A4C1Y6S9_EUMVA|nr:hypothetical protein EVAR_51367_1 [Eumeta japonica]